MYGGARGCVARERDSGSDSQPARSRTGTHLSSKLLKADPCRYYHDPEDGTACAKVNCDCTHICVPSWHQMWMATLQVTTATHLPPPPLTSLHRLAAPQSKTLLQACL